MSYFIYLIKHLLDLPATIFWNFCLFELPVAIKLPLLISRNVKIHRLHRGNFVLQGPIKPFCIKIGVEGTEGVSPERRSYISLGKEAKVYFRGKTNLARGISLRSGKGQIIFGNNFYANCNLSIICVEKVSFGDDVLLGWCVNIRDCDGHSIMENGEQMVSVKPVAIEEHVWIGAFVDILKGVTIGTDSVVAYRSCVLKPFPQNNVLIGGYPARVLKENIDWKV